MWSVRAASPQRRKRRPNSGQDETHAAHASGANSLLQCELLAQLGGDLVRKVLRIFRVFRCSHDGRSPAEDGISANRHEHPADQQALKNHVFKLGVCFCFLVHRTLFCRLPRPLRRNPTILRGRTQFRLAARPFKTVEMPATAPPFLVIG